MINSVSGLPAIFIEDSAAIQTKINNAERDRNLPNQKVTGEYKNKKAKLDSYIETETNQVNFFDSALKLKDLLGEENMAIEFTTDKDTKKLIMRLIDNKTNEIIQQFPPEIALKIARIVQSTLGNPFFTNAKV